jgi:hypothetical protein
MSRNFPDPRGLLPGVADMPKESEPIRPRTVPTLAEIASVFARYANTTFGGGSATIAVLREQILTRRGWIDEGEFDLNYALSRLTPGTNLLAFCTAAGWTARRWPGAVVALLASSLPCSILAVVMTVFYVELHDSTLFQAALRSPARPCSSSRPYRSADKRSMVRSRSRSPPSRCPCSSRSESTRYGSSAWPLP